MNKTLITMEIKIIITETTKTTKVKVLIDGAVSEYLTAIKQGANLAIVTDGIEEFCESLRKDNEE